MNDTINEPSREKPQNKEPIRGISPRWESAMIRAVIQQLLVVVITMMALDFGTILQTSTFAIVAMWAGVGLILLRRGRSPTAGDLRFVRLASIPLCIVSYLLSHSIWSWRGY